MQARGKRTRRKASGVRRPTRVYVGETVFDVAWKDSIGSYEVVGMYDQTNQQIAVFDSMAPDQARETLLHETLHAVWSMTPLGLSYPDRSPDSEGEKIIAAVSPWLYTTLRDRRNREVVRWLVE